MLRLDAAAPEEARRLLATSCGATRWVEGMLARRPFGTEDALVAAAHEIWASLDETDWLDAFAHHPRIGDREELRRRFPAGGHLSEQEQSGLGGAEDDVLEALKRGNDDYHAKFGWIFIVCAAGRTASEMLTLLRARLPNDPRTEIRIAAAEQARITELRLRQLEGGG